MSQIARLRLEASSSKEVCNYRRTEHSSGKVINSLLVPRVGYTYTTWYGFVKWLPCDDYFCHFIKCFIFIDLTCV